jgi:dephospho-CoA kinase
MLRVGLTGGLGSGKTTAAEMFARLGAHILSSDEIARELMQPGHAVFDAIVKKFGASVVRTDGTLNRGELARIAFEEERAEELNAIVHPATIARQEELITEIASRDPAAVVIVESALIFETKHSRDWRTRFDKMILVRASDELKIARFIQRSGGGDVAKLEAEARRRLARIIADDKKAVQCDFVITNDGSLQRLREQVVKIWGKLKPASCDEVLI